MVRVDLDRPLEHLLRFKILPASDKLIPFFDQTAEVIRVDLLYIRVGKYGRGRE